MINLGKYRPQLSFGGHFEDKKKPDLPDYTKEYLKVLQRPLKVGLIEFISTVIVGVMGYGKTVLAQWIAEMVIEFYGTGEVNAIMNRNADIEALLEAMDDKPVQLLFLDDSFGEMDSDIAKQFTLIRHNFKKILDDAKKPERGVIIALFGIQDIYTLDKLARRVSTAIIAKSSTGDKWYKNDLKQTFGIEGIRELDRITRKVTRDYDQSVKSRSVIMITGYDRTGYLESKMVETDHYTEVLSRSEEDSEPNTPRVNKEKRFTYDIAGDFIANIQRYIQTKAPKHSEDLALIYPWVIQKTPASHIMGIYADRWNSERTVQRRVAELLAFLHSGETARDIGLEIFEPWFREKMREQGHHVTASESTARGGIDAIIDGVVHTLKCYHQNRNTITIPLTEISNDELEAAKFKDRLVLVLMNPFWGTNPRYKEFTLTQLRELDKITIKPSDQEILSDPDEKPLTSSENKTFSELDKISLTPYDKNSLSASEGGVQLNPQSSQPHLRGFGGEVGGLGNGGGCHEGPSSQRSHGGDHAPDWGQIRPRDQVEGRGVETKEANVTSPDPVDYFINTVQEVTQS